MQPNYGKRNCGKVVILSAISITLGISLLVTWPLIFDTALKFGSTLSKNSMATKIWQENPMPLYLDFYLMNWTNPHEIYNKDVKPRFVEVGPVRFQETKTKVNITWNANNTVTFNQQKKWVFDEAGSAVGLDVNITSINPVTVSGSYQARNWGYWMKKGFQLSLSSVAPEIHITKTIGEIVFDGYEDFFVSFSKAVPFLSNLPQMDKFGWFYTRNNSYTFDGTFNMDTSQDNYGVLNSWNYQDKTEANPGKCGEVRGSAGELFKKHQNRTNIEFFSPDMCRTVMLDYEEDVKVNNIDGYKFSAGISLFDNGTLKPENGCFCNGECVPYGAVNVSECRYGTPAFVTLPHFYGADPYYTNSIEGLRPDKNKHQFYISLEPTTGIPIDVSARLQLNLLLQPIKYVRTFENVPKVFFPVLWFEQVAKIPDHLSIMLRFLLAMPLICRTLGFVFIVFGVSLIAYITHRPIIQLFQQRTHPHKKNIFIVHEIVPLTQGVIEKTRTKDNIKKHRDEYLLM